MSNPQAVVVVKPRVKTEVVIGNLLGGIGGIFLAAWFLNMIIPAVTPWELGYWQCIWLYIGANILFKSPKRLLHRITDLKGN